MAFFTQAQADAIAGSTVRVASLVQFDFASGTHRLWNGSGILEAGGEQWEGIAGLGAIDGLEETRGPVSQQVTFTLSGADADMLATAIGETSEVQGRLVAVYLQLFDDAWQTVGVPIAIWFGLMQPPRVTRRAFDDGSGAERVIHLPAENLFFGRSRPRAGRYNSADQHTRFHGDRGCDNVADLPNKTIIWPRYS